MMCNSVVYLCYLFVVLFDSSFVSVLYNVNSILVSGGVDVFSA